VAKTTNDKCEVEVFETAGCMECSHPGIEHSFHSNNKCKKTGKEHKTKE